MKKDKKHIIELDDYEMNQLMAILAYTGGKVTYPEGYAQHDELKKLAYTYHSFLLDDD